MLKDNDFRKELYDNIKANKEEILDLVQHLCEVVRFLDRPSNAMNKDFWFDYLELSYDSVNRIYNSEVRGYFAWQRLQKEFGESEA